jgi:hypothetical protein
MDIGLEKLIEMIEQRPGKPIANFLLGLITLAVVGVSRDLQATLHKRTIERALDTSGTLAKRRVTRRTRKGAWSSLAGGSRGYQVVESLSRRPKSSQ